MRAIVLSGGGARGSYQIGVWKALRKLKIPYDIVTGTSVGALNGAFMVQGSYEEALEMWENMDYSKVFDEHFSIDDIQKNKTFELLKTYTKGILSGGMNIQKLEDTIDTYMKPELFYQSHIRYGMVTFNISSMKPIQLSKEEIPKEQLKDYLIASATCFPAFPMKKIDGEYYIDGGYYDNLPLHLAHKLGADEIIAVDLDAIGRKQKQNVPVPVTYIEPKNPLGATLDFGKEEAKKGIQYGYFDTMKIFHKLDGNFYTFSPHHIAYSFFFFRRKIEKNWNQFLKRTGIQNWKQNPIQEKKEWEDLYLETLEMLGTELQLDKTVEYSFFAFRKELKKAFASLEMPEFVTIEKKIAQGKIKEVLKTPYLLKYLYEKGIKGNKEEAKTLCYLFPKEMFSFILLDSI